MVGVTLTADEKMGCINGHRSIDHLAKQYEASKTSPIYKAVMATAIASNDKTATDAGLPTKCETCEAAQKIMPVEAFENIKRYTQVRNRINSECALAAAKFDAATNEVRCPEGTKVKKVVIKNSKNRVVNYEGACVTGEMITYNSSAQENLYTCFKKFSTSPITPASLFEIFSLESTYKANYSSVAGHGMGQLTDIFVQDAQQKGRGLELLKKMALNETPECAVAQQLAAVDIGKTYRLPRDRCEFIPYGSGLERNMLFAMVGLNTLWEKNVSVYFSKYSKKYANDPNLPIIMEKVLQISYGAGGPTAARAFVSQNSDLSPADFLERLGRPMYTETGPSLTKYLERIADRQVSISKDLQEPRKSEFLKNGARACIE